MNKTERIKHLLTLKDGWLNGEGIAPNNLSAENITKLSQALTTLNIHHTIFPIPTGGLQIELTLIINTDIVCYNDGRIEHDDLITQTLLR
jgi:hypothetical protein